MKRDPVVAPAVLLVWGAVALFILYPLGRLLVLTFWNGGPSLDAVRGLVGDWTHRAALMRRLGTVVETVRLPGRLAKRLVRLVRHD